MHPQVIPDAVIIERMLHRMVEFVAYQASIVGGIAAVEEAERAQRQAWDTQASHVNRRAHPNLQSDGHIKAPPTKPRNLHNHSVCQDTGVMVTQHSRKSQQRQPQLNNKQHVHGQRRQDRENEKNLVAVKAVSVAKRQERGFLAGSPLAVLASRPTTVENNGASSPPDRITPGTQCSCCSRNIA